MKRYLFFLLIMLLINSISSLTISPNYIDAVINKDVDKIIPLELTNNKNYTLYNISIEAPNYVTINNIDKLSANTSVNINLKVNKNTIGTTSDNIKFIGFTKINCSELESQFYDINIMSKVYPTTFLCNRDKINFKNTFPFNMPLKIYYESGVLFEEVMMNVNATHTTSSFDENGNYYFECPYGLCYGGIDVREISSFVHSSSDDTLFVLNLSTILNKTILNIGIPTVNYSVDYNGYKTSFLTIENIGSEQASKINFSASKWITFDENNINLESGYSRAVNFIISPYITDASATNKTYNINLRIKADNSEEIIKNITVFIPYSSVLEEGENVSQYWIDKKRFCDSYPTSQLCISEPIIIYKNKTVYDSPPVNVSLTGENFNKLIIGLLTEQENRNILFNYIKQQEEGFLNGITNILNNVSDTNQQNIEIKEYLGDIKISLIIFVSSILFVFVFSILVYHGLKIYKNRRIMQGVNI